MISYATGGKESFKGKKVAISGSGNVAQYAALKAIELGATVVSLSDSKGAFIAEDGISAKLVEEIAALKVARKSLSELSTEGHGVKYIDGARPWTHVKVDIALPCATQNEVSGDEAEALVKSGAKFVAEGSNMGCTQEAIEVFETTRKGKKAEGTWYGPGKFSSLALHGLTRNRQGSQLWWCRRLRS
jgi:glutamate dehydrogenase (NADP+)